MLMKYSAEFNDAVRAAEEFINSRHLEPIKSQI